MTKTHYRNAYKSDHLSVADLEDFIEKGQSLSFTIKEVKQENTSVAGKKGTYNIAYFVEKIKPLVLNVHNSRIVKGFAGRSSFVENWCNIPVTLYIDYNVSMKGEKTEGVRINPVKPQATIKQKPIFKEENFEKAFNAGADVNKIKEIYSLSDEIEQKYIDYCTTKI